MVQNVQHRLSQCHRNMSCRRKLLRGKLPLQLGGVHDLVAVREEFRFIGHWNFPGRRSGAGTLKSEDLPVMKYCGNGRKNSPPFSLSCSFFSVNKLPAKKERLNPRVWAEPFLSTESTAITALRNSRCWTGMSSALQRRLST